MIARKAEKKDLESVFAIYARARRFMVETGNPTQWEDKYPTEEMVREDVQRQRLYVLEADGEACGVFAFLPEGDALYEKLDGQWLNDLPHGAIHRVASSGTKRGVMEACVQYCLTQTQNLKIDTHRDNRIMQHQLSKLGFVLCGTVTLPRGGERIAYQLYQENKKSPRNGA